MYSAIHELFNYHIETGLLAHGVNSRALYAIFEDAFIMQSFSNPTQYPDVSGLWNDLLAS